MQNKKTFICAEKNGKMHIREKNPFKHYNGNSLMNQAWSKFERNVKWYEFPQGQKWEEYTFDQLNFVGIQARIRMDDDAVTLCDRCDNVCRLIPGCPGNPDVEDEPAEELTMESTEQDGTTTDDFTADQKQKIASLVKAQKFEAEATKAQRSYNQACDDIIKKVVEFL